MVEIIGEESHFLGVEAEEEISFQKEKVFLIHQEKMRKEIFLTKKEVKVETTGILEKIGILEIKEILEIKIIMENQIPQIITLKILEKMMMVKRNFLNLKKNLKAQEINHLINLKESINFRLARR